MSRNRNAFRSWIAAALLTAGLGLSKHSFAQSPAVDDTQSWVVRRYNAIVMGRIGEYLADVERDPVHNPSDPGFSVRALALAYDSAGNSTKAMAEVERAWQQPDLPRNIKMDLAIAGHLVALGAKDTVGLKRWLAEMGRIDAGNQATFQNLSAGLDNPARSLADLQARLRDTATSESTMGNIAPWLAYYGDAAGALEALRRERLATGAVGSTSLWLSVYRNVRDLPGFSQLVQDIGLVDQWRKTGWGDFCKPLGTEQAECGSARAASGMAGKPAANIAAAADKDGWRQVGPHRTRLIQVEKDVKVEVVDWGGSGRPLVLLAGLGNTAHVFDRLAQKLAGSYHVYGVTRRGFGMSSAPETGYTADRLADDVIAVIRALRLDRPVVAGHSIAGGELSSIGARHAAMVAGLIYLDAHYPYAFHDKEVEDMIAAYQAARAPAQPATPRPLMPPDLIAAKVINGKQEHTKIGSSLLAIIAGQQGQPGAADPKIVEAQMKAIRVASPSSRIVYIPTADHYVFRSHEAEVLAEMHAFIASLKP